MKDQSSRVGSTYRKLSIPAKLAAIKSRKRHGDVRQIASDMGYSEPHVSNVLAGRYENKFIVNHAYNMTRSRPKAESGRS